LRILNLQGECYFLSVKLIQEQEGALRGGSATPMCGKSVTCRRLALKELTVWDRKIRSETCRGE